MELTSEREIKQLLERHGFRFSKSMGQNFLVDSSVPERIAEGSGVDDSVGVLEIGPGIGALTTALSRRAGHVLAVELDRSLLPILAETLADKNNTTVLNGDILKLDIAETVREAMPGLKYAVCANLPYNITTPVLAALFDAGIFDTVTVMIQKEVALRLCARPGTADYGAFSVLTQYHAEPRILFDVPPGVFIPQPKVTSAVVTMTIRKDKPDFIEDEAFFFRIVRASFAQRRKTLVNGLQAAFGSAFSKEQLAQLLIRCGINEKARGETLGLREFAAVARELKAGLQ